MQNITLSSWKSDTQARRRLRLAAPSHVLSSCVVTGCRTRWELVIWYSLSLTDLRRWVGLGGIRPCCATTNHQFNGYYPRQLRFARFMQRIRSWHSEYEVSSSVVLAKSKQAQRIPEHIITCTYSLYNDGRINLVKMKALDKQHIQALQLLRHII